MKTGSVEIGVFYQAFQAGRGAEAHDAQTEDAPGREHPAEEDCGGSDAGSGNASECHSTKALELGPLRETITGMSATGKGEARPTPICATKSCPVRDNWLEKKKPNIVRRSKKRFQSNRDFPTTETLPPFRSHISPNRLLLQDQTLENPPPQLTSFHLGPLAPRQALSGLPETYIWPEVEPQSLWVVALRPDRVFVGAHRLFWLDLL